MGVGERKYLREGVRLSLKLSDMYAGWRTSTILLHEASLLALDLRREGKGESEIVGEGEEHVTEAEVWLKLSKMHAG